MKRFLHITSTFGGSESIYLSEGGGSLVDAPYGLIDHIYRTHSDADADIATMRAYALVDDALSILDANNTKVTIEGYGVSVIFRLVEEN